MGFFVKPAYRTKSGKVQFAVYFQAPPRRGTNGEIQTVRAKPLLIASNALDDPEHFLQIVAHVLNTAISEQGLSERR
ncbi:hypothetical protein RM190_22665 [Paracoccus sp. CPCC 101403]|uniref:Uncharacterized protein n=1 Tax=Paracoccus broussonetiae TaxID=3075834 RepID=A0ABU3EK97_9RHOB|nr:hypothetical protein [Paracoccus sp. CPCC 101403]MDT1064676.1 hypothetical protein [Paracoccus sp. CPCC 101403]